MLPRRCTCVCPGTAEPNGSRLPLDPADPLRAPSVHWLKTGLLDQMEAAGFHRHGTVREIEERVIRATGCGLSCPVDGRLGSAYVDTITGIDYVGSATQMLSYTWDYTIADIVDSLVEFCSSRMLKPNRTYVWICAFCVNQHRVREARAKNEVVPFHTFAEEFGSRVKGIRHILALMGPWHEPRYVSRAWCLYEMSVALNIEDCRLEVLMPPREAKGFTEALMSRCDALQELRAILSRVCVLRAEASVETDKANIMRCVEQGIGLHNLNERLRRNLRFWFLARAEDEASISVQCIENDLCARPRCGILQVSHMLADHGQVCRAIRLLRCALKEAQAKHSLEAIVDFNAAIGALLPRQGDLAKAAAHLQDAQKSMASALPAQAINVFTSLGALALYQGDSATALGHLTEADRLFRLHGSGHPKHELPLLLDTAFAYADVGDIRAATDYYRKVVELRRTHSMPVSCASIGPMLVVQQPLDKETCLAQAQLCEELQLESRTWGMYVITILAYNKAQHDMLGEALELCDKALALRSGRDTPFVADTFGVKACIQEHLLDVEGATKSRSEMLRIRAGLGLPHDCELIDMDFCKPTRTYIKEKYGPELEKILADRSNGFPAPSTQKASTLAASRPTSCLTSCFSLMVATTSCFLRLMGRFVSPSSAKAIEASVSQPAL